MPTVNGKKFAYTSKGITDAEKAKEMDKRKNRISQLLDATMKNTKDPLRVSIPTDPSKYRKQPVPPSKGGRKKPVPMPEGSGKKPSPMPKTKTPVKPRGPVRIPSGKPPSGKLPKPTKPAKIGQKPIMGKLPKPTKPAKTGQKPIMGKLPKPAKVGQKPIGKVQRPFKISQKPAGPRKKK
jgi:hypothetical protein